MAKFFDTYSGYGSYSSRNFAFDTIKGLIQDGTKELNNNFDENSFNRWFEYSQKILELATKDNPNILLNYLRLSVSISSSNLLPHQKLKMCLDYLLKILEIV